MKAMIYRSFSLALIAAPIGWICEGLLLAAAEHRGEGFYRLYASGDHLTGAALAAGLIFAAAMIWQRGSSSIKA